MVPGDLVREAALDAADLPQQHPKEKIELGRIGIIVGLVIQHRLLDHVQNRQPGGIATGQLQGPPGCALGASGKISGHQDVAERIGIREFC